ncbi:sporulation integral membrane protein YlbJ [Marinicrinis sediminis]
MTGMLALFILYPQPLLQASMQGLDIWWEVLFPALFPFLVISELMLGFGIVHFFGTLLDPLMRPLFRVPGLGGFVLAMGFASGYPVGSRLTAQLREQQLISRTEGERLISFTTTSDPIFLIGAVSVGFFHQAEIAVVLALAHYSAALLVGLLYRFYGTNENKVRRANSCRNDHAQIQPPRPIPDDTPPSGSLLREAFMAMHRSRIIQNKPVGTLLRESIQSAVQLVMVIGGLVVFFSVLIACLEIVQILDRLYDILAVLFAFIALPVSFSVPIVSGLFEVTLGAKHAGNLAGTESLKLASATAALLLSWGGLSVHAQVASLINRTDMRMRPFIAARLIHGLLAFVLVLLLWPFTPHLEHVLLPVWSPDAQSAFAVSFTSSLQVIRLFLFLLLGLLLLSWLMHHIRRIVHLLRPPTSR